MVRTSTLLSAEQQLVAIGARITPARLRVLAFLLAQANAVAHRDIEEALNKQEKIDRVTLYRILDWLTANALVHKVALADQAWHFSVNHGGASEYERHHHQHAHFKCNRCERVLCLDDLDMVKHLPALPAGCRGIELS